MEKLPHSPPYTFTRAERIKNKDPTSQTQLTISLYPIGGSNKRQTNITAQAHQAKSTKKETETRIRPYGIINNYQTPPSLLTSRKKEVKRIHHPAQPSTDAHAQAHQTLLAKNSKKKRAKESLKVKQELKRRRLFKKKKEIIVTKSHAT